MLAYVFLCEASMPMAYTERRKGTSLKYKRGLWKMCKIKSFSKGLNRAPDLDSFAKEVVFRWKPVVKVRFRKMSSIEEKHPQWTNSMCKDFIAGKKSMLSSKRERNEGELNEEESSPGLRWRST